MNNPKIELLVEDLHEYFGADEVLKGITLEEQESNLIALLRAGISVKSTFYANSFSWKISTSGKVYPVGELIHMKKDRYGETKREDIRQVERLQIGWECFSEVQSVVSSDDGFGKCHRGPGACAKYS